MIAKDTVIQIVNEKIAETDYFLISVEISQNNEIVVAIDSDFGVDLNFCAELSRHIETILDREKEDFELEVGSYGISRPFAVVRQYSKNIDKNVEILTQKGLKFRGVLVSVSPDFFAVEIEKMVKPDGKKRKELQKDTVNFNYSEIKYAKLDF
ncbi:MAG: ribosome assembly cofactor RimP [Prevotellaceae bacterium]|jgi:ribosome maturation factor RimP|nr:ribosome assembly cofactor RimP [Prevotellaceae bacterium]